MANTISSYFTSYSSYSIKIIGTMIDDPAYYFCVKPAKYLHMCINKIQCREHPQFKRQIAHMLSRTSFFFRRFISTRTANNPSHIGFPLNNSQTFACSYAPTTYIANSAVLAALMLLEILTGDYGKRFKNPLQRLRELDLHLHIIHSCT